MPPQALPESKYVTFYKSIPPLEADQEAVQAWLKTWLIARGVDPTTCDICLKKLWWDGQDLRHLKESDMAAQLKLVGRQLEIFALSLAQDIRCAGKVEKVSFAVV